MAARLVGLKPTTVDTGPTLIPLCTTVIIYQMLYYKAAFYSRFLSVSMQALCGRL
jgi:hypothetical protein